MRRKPGPVRLRPGRRAGPTPPAADQRLLPARSEPDPSAGGHTGRGLAVAEARPVPEGRHGPDGPAPSPTPGDRTLDRVAVSAGLLAAAAIAMEPGIGLDAWWHLAAGRWMANHGAVVTTDPFSFTRLGEAWVHPGWPVDLLLYLVHGVAGQAGLNLLVAAVFTAAFALLWRLLAGPPLLRLGVLLLAALTSAVGATPRPLVFSLLLTAGFVMVLERERHAPTRWLWALPAGMAVWANVHGAFAAGLLLLGLHLTGQGVVAARGARRSRRTWRDHRRSLARPAAVLAASVVAVTLNPFGWRMLLYPVRTVGLDSLGAAIQEWQPPDFTALESLPLLVLLVAAVVVLARSRRPVHPTEILLVAVFGYLALTAVRHAPLFALAAAPVLARHAATLLPARRGTGAGSPPGSRSRPRGPRWAPAAVVGLSVVLAVGAAVPALTPAGNAATGKLIPVEAVKALERHRPPGELFHDYGWGGYLIWTLPDAHPTYIDGRTDLFGDALMAEYLATRSARPGWEETLKRRGIRTALIGADSPLAAALTAAGWHTLYRDAQAVLLTAPAASASQS